MARNNDFSLVTTGTIAPATIAKFDGSINEGCAQATASSDAVAGITMPWQKGTPGLAGSDVAVAYTVGMTVPINGYGNDCMLYIGSGGCIPGSLLTPDSAGYGVIAARASGKVVAAIALQIGAQNEQVRVMAVAPFTA